MGREAKGSALAPWIRICGLCSAAGSTLNSVLFDAWVQCDGDWSKSEFYMKIRHRHTTKAKGTRRWLFAGQMDELYGAVVAQKMRDFKETDEKMSKTDLRYHPQVAPGEEAGWPTCLPLCAIAALSGVEAVPLLGGG